jgi:hypothetical protein
LRAIATRPREWVDIATAPELDAARVLLDKVGDLVDVAHREFVGVQEALRCGVRVLVGVVREFEDRSAPAEVDVKDVVVLLPLVQLLARRADGVRDLADLLPRPRAGRPLRTATRETEGTSARFKSERAGRRRHLGTTAHLISFHAPAISLDELDVSLLLPRRMQRLDARQVALLQIANLRAAQPRSDTFGEQRSDLLPDRAQHSRIQRRLGDLLFIRLSGVKFSSSSSSR